ncbi:hypothetical protein AN958_00720 [Leucoagaricus sp. SymC.cos]|nr:hypothetical protein AN958_00720 [Leucoagaricus sp. SymC.cos]
MTTWEDLPPEILEQIVYRLDRPSLLALGQLSRRLNSTALIHWLGEESYMRLIRLQALKYYDDRLFNKESTSVLSVLSKSLWISELDIHDIEWYMRTTLDFLSLATIIEHAAPHLETLSIYILYSVCKSTHPAVVSDLVARLLDTAQSRGCRSLALKGFTPLCSQYLYEGYQVTSKQRHAPEKQSAIRAFSSWVRRHVLRSAKGVTTGSVDAESSSAHQYGSSADDPPPGEACLEQVKLDNPLFFEPIFAPYTADLLSKNAQTIKLILLQPWYPTLPSVREIVFTREFPALERLSITSPIPFTDLVDFCLHHPRISHLSISLDHDHLLRRTASRSGAAFQNVTHLKANFSDIKYFLSPPDALPKLESVHLYSNLEREVWNDGERRKIAAVDETMFRSSTVPLRLELNLAGYRLDKFVSHWMEMQMESTREHALGYSAEKPSSAREANVVEFVLDCGYQHVAGDQFAAIKQWITRLSSVKALQFQESVFGDTTLDESFCDSIIQACPQLQIFVYGLEHIVTPEGPVDENGLVSRWQKYRFCEQRFRGDSEELHMCLKHDCLW